ncbi:hypothetical protein [Rubellimicrobium arenae]|uniref:hypothetical protein n=1 Tax=Rubellimicrobium arenae TaxID=2817372 RepID=UPI001B308E50|nr:hypothetical protein [Rubellimicrobium arenae]
MPQIRLFPASSFASLLGSSSTVTLDPGEDYREVFPEGTWRAVPEDSISPELTVDAIVVPPQNTVPAAFAEDQWRIEDKPSPGGNTATIYVDALPANGGAAITALEYQLSYDRGVSWSAWIALAGGATLGGRDVAVIPSAIPVRARLRARNVVGPSVLISYKTVTPTSTSTQTLANQSLAFGALTLAGADGAKVVNSLGAEVDITGYVSLVSGSLGAYTPVVENGRLKFTGAAGAPNGAVLRVSYAGGNVDVTITTVANTYGAASLAECIAVNQLGSATLSGKQLLLRMTATPYVFGGSTALANRAFTSTFTLGSWSLVNRATILAHHNAGNDLQVSGSTNLRFYGLRILGEFVRGGGDANDFANTDGEYAYIVACDGEAQNLTFEGCIIRGNLTDLGPGTHFRGVFGGNGSGRIKGAQGFTFINNDVSGSRRGLNTLPGKKTIRGNIFREIGNDCIVVRNSADNGVTDHSLVIADNIMCDPYTDATDINMVVSNGVGARLQRASDLTTITDSQRALLYLRFSPDIKGKGRDTLRTLFALGSAFQVTLTTANRLRVVARAPNGTVVLDMTTANQFYGPFQNNVLISLNTAGTSRIWSWTEFDRADRNEGSWTAAGQTLDLTGGTVSIGSMIDGTVPYRGSISVVALWSGVAPDISQVAVRDDFYEKIKTGLPKSRDIVIGTYGEPPLDIRSFLVDWRAGRAQKGTGGAMTILPGTGSIDIPHYDFLQFVTNTSGDPAFFVSPGPGLIAGNVMLSFRLDGGPAFNAAQAMFMEDIQAAYTYNGFDIFDNLIVTASQNGVTIYNPVNCRIVNNTMVLASDLLPPEDYWSKAPRIALRHHNVGVGPETIDNVLIADNVTRAVNVDAGATNIVQSNNRIVDIAATSGPTAYATVFDGINNGFSLADLGSIAAVRAMYKIRDSLRAPYQVREGVEGYATFDPYTPPASRPRFGTATSPAIPAVTNAQLNTAIETAPITPTGVPATGVIVTSTSDIRLLDSANAVLRDYGAGHIILLPGQRYQLRTNSSVNANTEVLHTVRIGLQELTWSVTTRTIPRVATETFAADTTGTWTTIGGTKVWNSAGQAMQLRNGVSGVFSSVSKAYTGAQIVVGGSYRVRIYVQPNGSSPGLIQAAVGREGASQAYLANTTKAASAAGTPIEVTIPETTTAEILVTLTHRNLAGDNAQAWDITEIQIDRMD